MRGGGSLARLKTLQQRSLDRAATGLGPTSLADTDPASIAPAWRAALVAFDQDLRRRAVAEKTRRAYAIDSAPVRRLGEPRASSSPASIDVRALRRYAAASPSAARRRRPSRASSPRCGRCSACQVELGAREENPAELLSSPKRAQRLPRVLKPARSRRCSTASRPRRRSSCATGRCSSSPTPPGCAPRSSSRSSVESIDFDAEAVRVEGKGGKTRVVPVGEHALRAIERYLARAGGARVLGRRTRARAVPLEVRPAARDLRCPPPAADLDATGRGAAFRRSPTRIRTPCATRSPRTCSRAAPTCARSRSCLATQPSRRLRSTLG